MPRKSSSLPWYSRSIPTGRPHDVTSRARPFECDKLNSRPDSPGRAGAGLPRVPYVNAISSARCPGSSRARCTTAPDPPQTAAGRLEPIPIGPRRSSGTASAASAAVSNSDRSSSARQTRIGDGPRCRRFSLNATPTCDHHGRAGPVMSRWSQSPPLTPIFTHLGLLLFSPRLLLCPLSSDFSRFRDDPGWKEFTP